MVEWLLYATENDENSTFDSMDNAIRLGLTLATAHSQATTAVL